MPTKSLYYLPKATTGRGRDRALPQVIIGHAHYDVRASNDQMRRVETNSDKASTTLKEMTVQMEKLLDLAAGAADAVDDDR
ncbi:hypothetical protein Bca101_053636 [Brassica carinata]